MTLVTDLRINHAISVINIKEVSTDYLRNGILFREVSGASSAIFD